MILLAASQSTLPEMKVALVRAKSESPDSSRLRLAENIIRGTALRLISRCGLFTLPRTSACVNYRPDRRQRQGLCFSVLGRGATAHRTSARDTRSAKTKRLRENRSFAWYGSLITPLQAMGKLAGRTGEEFASTTTTHANEIVLVQLAPLVARNRSPV